MGAGKVGLLADDGEVALVGLVGGFGALRQLRCDVLVLFLVLVHLGLDVLVAGCIAQVQFHDIGDDFFDFALQLIVVADLFL